jgi:hypothetical protein
LIRSSPLRLKAMELSNEQKCFMINTDLGVIQALLEDTLRSVVFKNEMDDKKIKKELKTAPL